MHLRFQIANSPLLGTDWHHEWKAKVFIHIMALHMSSHVVLCATHVHSYHYAYSMYVFIRAECT